MTHELEMAARHHDFALGELANSRPAAAVKALKQSLALDPKRASAHHDLGLALQDLGRLEEAERAHRDALSLDPSHAAAYLSLGELLQSRGALEEARSCFESALRLARSPAPAGIYMQLGGVLWKLGDSMRALEAFERAVAGAPGSAEAHYNLGSAQLELGRFDAAERSAREVLRLRPGLSEALTLRAAAIAASGSIDAAVELLRQPGGQDAAAAQHYKALAIRLLNSRLFDPARRCMEAVLREDPTEAMAHHLLSALSGANPDHPIEGYVRQLFDASASSFDQELVSKLGYDIPREMVDAVLSIAGAPGERWDVLDLGCGTGLVGERLASCCRRLVGVDLAPNMIERARARNLYTELQCTDLLAALALADGKNERFHLVTAADVFIYVGKLDAIIPAIRRVLRPGGRFAFSAEAVECIPGARSDAYRLGVMGRYAHGAEYLRRLAELSGFDVELLRPTRIRLEHRCPVEGWLTVWRVPN